MEIFSERKKKKTTNRINVFRATIFEVTLTPSWDRLAIEEARALAIVSGLCVPPPSSSSHQSASSSSSSSSASSFLPRLLDAFWSHVLSAVSCWWTVPRGKSECENKVTGCQKWILFQSGSGLNRRRGFGYTKIYWRAVRLWSAARWQTAARRLLGAGQTLQQIQMLDLFSVSVFYLRCFGELLWCRVIFFVPADAGIVFVFVVTALSFFFFSIEVTRQIVLSLYKHCTGIITIKPINTGGNCKKE